MVIDDARVGWRFPATLLLREALPTTSPISRVWLFLELHTCLSHRNSSSVTNDGSNLIYVDVPSLDLPFCFLGLGPVITSSRPNSKRCIPLFSLQKSRVCLKLYLFLFSKFLCRLMEVIVNGRRLEPNHTILLYMLVQNLSENLAIRIT
ncbi:hypothetical protein ISN44_As01g016000 [Arabidopsis suecica]|uniref:Uncharacterized protein n=1 Tax=Arabidopsis suecica TaxID=45249 RepID=A0A8T2H4X5_ARASU|nr:hypothetical protein ISN44_As01g016000 [Arabidopsis suecica]